MYSDIDTRTSSIIKNTLQIAVCCVDVLVSLQADTCYIDKMCYEDGGLNPQDSRLVCKPSISKDQWSVSKSIYTNIYDFFEIYT